MPDVVSFPDRLDDQFIQTFRALFVGRSDAYLDEKRRCVKEPLTDEILREHLRGERRIGAYSLIQSDGAPQAKFFALDFDGKNLPGGRDQALEEANRAADTLEGLGLAAYREISRSYEGFHVWVFFGNNPVRLDLAQELGQAVIVSAQLTAGTEVFPKGKPTDPYGCTPFLPLWGLHGAAERQTLFVDAKGQPLANQEDLLCEVSCTTASEAETVVRRSARPESPAATQEDVAQIDDRWVSRALRGVSEGERNQTLTRLAGYLRRRLPLDVGLSVLRGWGGRCSPPLDLHEVDRTVCGVYERYGSTAPEDVNTTRELDLVGALDLGDLPSVPNACG